jgi:eukaryotic-like serine/threonine-protein kinase
MIAQSLAHYRILKKLGKGGMGEVYLALDTKLNRNVAIKVVSTESVANESSVKRLVREAQAAAKLDHSNICAIYDVNEVDSLPFIVLQYVEGHTLAEKMHDKHLRLSTALDIARQATEALVAAHAKGIIHRDIKPQNLMITPQGQVKVLDFGLCKFQPAETVDHEAATESLLSTPGSLMGTMPYMSPEQIRGDQVDQRADIFSLGVTVYEMVAGKHPFKAENNAVTMSNILLAEPRSTKRLQDLASPELQQLLARMLSKDKEERFQTAEELLTALKQLQPFDPLDETQSLAAASKALASNMVPTPSAKTDAGFWARRKTLVVAVAASLAVVILAFIGFRYWRAANKFDSLAVLPFTYASNDSTLLGNPDREYLSDGLTDGIINNLSQLPDLKVIARSSVFHYKGKDMTPQAIGRELNVRAVLVGQIGHDGNDLSIKAELIDVATNSSLGLIELSRKTGDMQAVEKEIVKKVADKLRLNLSGSEEKNLVKSDTESGEAYENYLKGRYHWNKRTDEGFKQAAEFFQKAINEDPTYALAYTGLADSYTLRSDYGFLAPTEGYALAKGAATLALKYNDKLAEAHTSLASIKAVTDWDWSGAENEYRQAIELNPNYATAHHWYATQLMLQGRFDEALNEIKKAQQLDPLSLGINKDHAVILLYAREYDKALEQCKKTLEIEPNFGVMATYVAQIYQAQQKYSQATAELEAAHNKSPEDGEITYGLAQAYALNGEKDQAKRLANELNQTGKQTVYLPKEAAYLSYLLGDLDGAISTLQKACDNHYISVAELKKDPRLDRLREDARVSELLQRIGLADK